MRGSLVVVSVVMCLGVNISARTLSRTKRADKYTSKYDNIDVDRILGSKRLLLNYINCLLDKGPCSPEGSELKNIIPEALATKCEKCSDIQKKYVGKILDTLLLNYRKEWDLLIQKYDPEGKYKEWYEGDDYDYSELDAAKK